MIVAYYLIGLPTACVLAFSAKQGAAGMVSGMLIGKCSHALAFGWLTARTDWEVAAANAARRVKEEAAAAAAGATPSGEMSKAEEEVEEADQDEQGKTEVQPGDVVLTGDSLHHEERLGVYRRRDES